jgi:rhodanese-related sulfurtransferase
MTPSALLAAIDSGSAPLILDVRSRWEFSHGHVPGAVHIPFWKFLAGAPKIPAAERDRIVVYCGHGPRAWLATAALRRRGFRSVTLLEGHMAGWKRLGSRL